MQIGIDLGGANVRIGPVDDRLLSIARKEVVIQNAAENGVRLAGAHHAEGRCRHCGKAPELRLAAQGSMAGVIGAATLHQHGIGEN